MWGPRASGNPLLVDERTTAERFRDYRSSGCRRLRNELVDEHRHLALAAARRFAHRGEPLDDLQQVALLGLVKAVERYDPAKGTAFSSFALPTMLGELRRHFRDATWPVHVPRGLQELHLELSATRERLHQDLCRSPTVDELASASGASVEDVIQALCVGNAYRTDHIHADADRDADERPALALADEDGELRRAEDRLDLVPGLARLHEREQHILHLRFVEQRTQADIARQVGLSQVQISRLLRTSLDQLRSSLLAGTG